MKPLLNKTFLNDCRALIDKACETDAALRGKLKKSWTWILDKFVLKFIGIGIVLGMATGFFLAPAFICFVSHVQETELLCCYGMAFATIWSIAFIIIRQGLISNAFGFPAVFLYVPVHPDDARALVRRALMKPPWCFCLSLFLLLCSLAVRCDALSWTNILLACGLSVLYALAGWAVAAWMAHVKPRPPLRFFTFVLSAASVVVAFILVHTAAHKEDTPFVLWIYQHVAHYGEACALLTPGGWAAGVFSASIQNFSPNWWYALAPLIGLSLSLPFALRSLERRFSFEQSLQNIDLSFATDPFDEDEAQPQGHGQPATALADTVDMEDVRKQWTYTCATSRIGWLERLCLRWLSPQEKVTLEQLTLRFPRWTTWLLYTLGIWLVSIPLLPLTFEYNNNVTVLAGMVFALSTLALVAITLPSFTGIAKKDATFGTFYPFSIQTLFSIRQKAALVRCILVAPIFLAIGLIAFFNVGVCVLAGFIAVKILLMATLGLPYISTLPTRKSPAPVPFYKEFFRFLIWCGLVIVFFVLAALSFTAQPLLSCLFVLLFILYCRFCLSVFISWYDRGDYNV